MKTFARPVLLISHLAALLLGLAWFRTAHPAPIAEGNAASSRQANAPAVAASDPAPAAKRPRTRAASPSDVHRAAWKALATQGLTRPERMKASALLLQGWIQEDWRAALDMVMKETPDDFSLLDEFAVTFAEEPEAVWQLIEERRYGVLSRTLLGRWQSSLMRLDEESVRKLAATLSDEGKQAALETLLRAKNVAPYTGGG